MLDDSQDAIGLPGLIEEIKGEAGLISETRWATAPQLWEVQGNKCPKSFDDIWDGAKNVSERQKVLSALVKQVEEVSGEVETWISQTIAHEVKEHRRSKNPPMEGNITNAAEVCIRVIRKIIQLLANIEPAEAEPIQEWRLSL